MINPTFHDTRIQSSNTLVLGNVCKDCNNCWMSKLENNFKPILNKLLIKRQNLTSLNKYERQTIALWSFKTALVINAGSNYRRIIPESHYIHLYEHQTLIKNVRIDVGFIKSKNDLLWRQSNIGFGLALDSEENDIIERMAISYKISLQIKFIGMRISFFPLAKESGYQINFSALDKNIRIWPYSKNFHFNTKSEYKNIDEFDLDCGIKPAHNK